ncbi:hypothetical protein [Nonomuraea zeae]|uniref:DNA-binding protein n=1 Tax=Nonomuraea zeae TaxID=1642303 RepID=A0A5S4FML0_9ACTN|nr:hypothetical protein [Nonomuraea zeae]TMR21664.1 hypothetical protein ETD85_50535 [Nonomuraea zeae]
MTTWNFRVILNREPTDEEIIALYDAGLDDCSVAGGREGDMHLMCTREADNLLDAIASVLIEVRTVPGLWAVGVGQGDGVTLGDAARRHGGRTQASLRQLASGQRGPGGFPRPVIEADNISIYSWAEVSDWLRVKMGDDIPAVPRDIALADAAVKLACRARAAHQETRVRHLVGVA